MRRFAQTWSVACYVLLSSPALAADPSNDLIGAFIATYQQKPPLIRTIKQPIFDDEHSDQMVELLTLTANLAPVRLVRLKRDRYALLVSETVQNAGHSSFGAFSIAYLTDDKDWRLQQTWPEMTFMGERGMPADKTWEAKFGSEPLVLASSSFCNMGGCEAEIAAFALGEKAPRFLGTVPGDAEYSNDSEIAGDCETYHYTARIGAPLSRKNVLSVRYSGWTAPPGRTKPKHWFWRRTDYASAGNN